MPVPVTFSGPGESFKPSYEDSLRYAVWMMFMADNVNRADMSADPSDENARVRIYQKKLNQNPETGEVVTPQQCIAVARTRWTYRTGKGGRKSITIAVVNVEAPDESNLPEDVTEPAVTPEAKQARMEEILMRGTVWTEDEDQQRFVVIDPYNSPRNEDGTYDPATWTVLTTKLPDIQPTTRDRIPNKFITSREQLFGLHPVTDFVVTYGVTATFEIEVPDREKQHGGD